MRARNHLAAALLAFVIIKSVAAQSAADLVLVNANIRTLDKRNPRAASLASVNGKIVAVGAERQIRPLIGPKTRVIDAGGRLVIPGFNDAHVHFTAIGIQFFHLDARDASVGEKLLGRIRKHATFLPDGTWILGSGLERTAAATLSERDAAGDGHPLLVYFAGSQFAAVNSMAMRLAGISDPDGIVEGEEVTRIRQAVPADYGRNWNEIIEAASAYAASLGVTSVQDVHSDDLFDVYLDIARRGKLKTRIYECIGLNDRHKLVSSGSRPGQILGLVRNGCVKGLATGEEGEVGELANKIAEATEAGLQVMIHAIGDSANANALEALELAMGASKTRDLRHRIEHAHRPDPSDLVRFVRSKTIASMQPHLFYSDLSKTDDNFQGMLSAGITLAFGSDAPMIDFNPLLGIHAAVNAGRNSISVEAAVRAYSVGSAFAEFQDGVKGPLSRGMAADFVVLSNDIFTMDRSRIREVRVMTTVMDGSVVYEH